MLIFAAVNYLRSWHDSRVAAGSGLYYPNLVTATPSRLCILADSAFPRTGAALQSKIVRARKASEHGAAGDTPRSEWLAAVDLLLDRAMPS